jgi:hypothetical protein
VGVGLIPLDVLPADIKRAACHFQLSISPLPRHTAYESILIHYSDEARNSHTSLFVLIVFFEPASPATLLLPHCYGNNNSSISSPCHQGCLIYFEQLPLSLPGLSSSNSTTNYEMPLARFIRSHRDSWPPTQVRLNGTLPNDEVEDIDEDPLTYFLTPAPSLDDDADMGVMDFDAGIEDSSHPPEIVRSVSPSSLDGLSRPRSRKASPEPELSDGPILDEEDDEEEEEYIRFQPNRMGLPFSLRDFTIDGVKMKPRSFTTPILSGNAGTADALLSPSSFHVSPSRGRTSARANGGRARSLSARRRPQRLWREPSPDVWSIEEETEEELMSEIGSSVAAGDIGDDEAAVKDKIEEIEVKEVQLEVLAAKPKKKVRFVLPVKD